MAKYAARAEKYRSKIAAASKKAEKMSTEKVDAEQAQLAAGGLLSGKAGEAPTCVSGF